MEEIKKKIEELETEMQRPDFWGDKIRAREVIKRSWKRRCKGRIFGAIR